MRKVTKFTLVSGNRLEDLINKVNERLVEGWQPFGNLIDYDHDNYYYLAMVKYEEDV